MKYLFLLILTFISFATFSNDVIDSLKNEILTATDDSIKADLHIKIAHNYNRAGKTDEAEEYYLKALEIAKQIPNDELQTSANWNLGILYRNTGRFEKALEHYGMANEIILRKGDRTKEANLLTNIAMVYDGQGMYSLAQEYYVKAELINEELGNKESLIYNYQGIGGVYFSMEDYEEAFLYFKKGLDLAKELENKPQASNSLNNVASALMRQNKFREARFFLAEAVRLNKELKLDRPVALNYMNMSECESNAGNNDSALHYNLEAIRLYEKYDDRLKMAENYLWRGRLFFNSRKLNESEQWYVKALNIAEELNSAKLKMDAYKQMSYFFEKVGKYKESLEYCTNYHLIKDSITGESNMKEITRIEMQQHFERDQAVQKLEQEKKDVLAEAELQRQKLLVWSFGAGFLIFLVLAILILRQYKQKKKANILLEVQKAEIAVKNEELNQQNEEISAQRDMLSERNDQILHQKSEIEESRNEITAQRDLVTTQKESLENINKEVTDSIHYAKRIQAAILPYKDFANELLPEHFVIYHPKDIVSGDFYWMTKVEGITIIAAADCTGHGVPGAFMSMLGAAFLNEIINKEYITHTGVILRKLRKEIIRALQQNSKKHEQKDGMDISLCSINMETGDLQFSGANNPLYIIRNKELPAIESDKQMEYEDKILYEIRGDSMPIAIYERMDKFTAHEIKLIEGDMLYMFTDGYADQFGGPKGKKFKYKPFKELIIENSNKSMADQKNVLVDNMISWMEGYEQVDDITMLGIKVILFGNKGVKE